MPHSLTSDYRPGTLASPIAPRREGARRRLGQWLPMYPPFGASWQKASRPAISMSSTRLPMLPFPRHAHQVFRHRCDRSTGRAPAQE